MNPKNRIDHLNSLTSTTFYEDIQVKEWFTSLYLRTHAGESQNDADTFYEREATYFKMLLLPRKDLREATVFSLYCVFMDIVVNGLSFDPGAKLVYVETRNINVGTDAEKAWQKHAKLVISPYGEYSLRVKCGQVKHIDTPIIVYSGDVFGIGYNDRGNKYIKWEAMLPRANDAKIIASVIKVTRPDGTFDFTFLTEQDIDRLSNYSRRQQKGDNPKANALYSSGVDGQIDTGFLAAKTIRHAFKVFPKVSVLGTNSSLEEDPIETENEAIGRQSMEESTHFKGTLSYQPAPGSGQPNLNQGEQWTGQSFTTDIPVPEEENVSKRSGGDLNFDSTNF